MKIEFQWQVIHRSIVFDTVCLCDCETVRYSPLKSSRNTETHVFPLHGDDVFLPRGLCPANKLNATLRNFVFAPPGPGTKKSLKNGVENGSFKFFVYAVCQFKLVSSE